MAEHPTVGHVMRRYLLPTETFVGNQITTLKRYRPVVLCYDRLENTSYPVDRMHCILDRQSSVGRAVDRGLYRAARTVRPASVRLLTEQARQEGVQLLHFHYLVDARCLLHLKRQTGLPAMVSAYGYDVSSFPRWYGGYGYHYLKPIFGELDLFVAMSEDMRRDMRALGCPDEKIIVHYYGSDCSRFRYPERSYPQKDEMTIFSCGTLQEKKAQHLVLEALRLVEQRGMVRRRFRVVLVGDGPLRPRLEQQIAAYGWQDKVTLVGHVPHHEQMLVDAYRQADIFTLPSITVKGDKEGIPGTIVEAMAAGLPVVATYHAGIPAIIEAGRDGVLVREGDIEAMARAFATLIEHAPLRAYLGRAAAERARRELDLQQRTRNLEAIYDNLLPGKG